MKPANLFGKIPATIGGFTLAYPQALYLVIPIAILLVWWLWQARSLRRAIAPILRALVLVLFTLALADPQTVTRSQGTTRPAVVDASASITSAMRQYAINLLSTQLKYRPGDPAMMFAGNAVDTTISGLQSSLDDAQGCTSCGPGSTDLQAALEKLASDPAAHNGPVVLITDGWQNRGDADAALNALRAAGIHLDIFTPPGAKSIPNIAMTALNLPPVLPKAEPFALGVTLSNLNSTPASGTIQLFRNGQLLNQRKVTIPPGQMRYDFPVQAEASGLIGYRAVFKPDNAAMDVYPEDDSLQGWVGIGAQRKILILTDSSRDANYLSTVVRRTGFDPTIDVLSGRQFAGGFKGYDAIILNNVARSQLSPAAQDALVQYVANGGSLAMVGGDRSFGLGGWEGSSVARVMPVIMKPPQRRERTRALVLIIDKSGSMGRNDKLVYAKLAARTVTKTLKPTDLLSVIGFDSQPFVIIPLEPVSQSLPYFDKLIDRLRANGTTYLMPALQEADRVLARSGAAIKHVVILTDGETGGTATMYYDLVSSMHHDGGVTISTIAVGEHANVPLLQEIARYGGGGFYQTDSPRNLPQLFLQDVKLRTGDTTMVEKTFVPHTPKPNDLLKGLADRQLPALKGFVATQLKPGATLSMFVNSYGNRDPIIASWRFGGGKALAVTTDASGRWSSLWVEDGSFGPIWDRMLGWMTPHKPTGGEQNFGVALGYRSGRIKVDLTDYSESPASVDRPINATVAAPNGAKSEAILSQQVPGEFSGTIEAPEPGTYHITLLPPPGGGFKKFPPLAYTVSQSINAELPRSEPNYALLEHLAAETGGRLNPSPDELAMQRPQFEHTVSRSPYLVVAAMILLIGEALIRRLTF